MLHQAAHDAAAEAVPREALDAGQQLLADEGARRGAQLLHELLQHVVRVRRLRGLAHVALELQGDRLRADLPIQPMVYIYTDIHMIYI